MICLNPMKIWKVGIENGKIKYKITRFNVEKVQMDNLQWTTEYQEIPCGKCENCCKTNAKEWGVRLALEAKHYEDKYFITLTYDDEHIPENGSLRKEDAQKFIHKIRDKIRYQGLKIKFKYLLAGEYGSRTYRPHYHLIILGLPITDLERPHVINNNLYYKSKTIESFWQKGSCEISKATIGNMFYTSQYVSKKITREKEQKIPLKSNYEKVGIEKEFLIMSKGIGKRNLSIYERGAIVQGQKLYKLGYQDYLMKKYNPYQLKDLKKEAQKKAEHTEAITYFDTGIDREKKREIAKTMIKGKGKDRSCNL